MPRVRVLRDVIIPRLISDNKFGNNVKLVDVEIDKKYLGEDHFASSVVFADILVKNHELVKHSLVIKYEVADESLRKMMWTEMQFRNEIFAYETVLPFLFETCGRSVDDFFPKYYHGASSYGKNRPEDDIIVIEDLRPKGFRLAEGRLYLDYDHVVLALKKLAEFHSYSYIAKQENRDEFFEKVKKSRYMYEEGYLGKSEPHMFVYTAERAVRPIMAKNDKKLNEIIERFQRNVDDSAQLLQLLGAPIEPSAVFCHGDYCRNNLLFKYDESTNKPVDIRFFDLAQVRYTSPVIDLSLFLFLNVSAESRRLHWDEFLSIYYDTLVRSVPRQIMVPTFGQLVEEFQEKGVYGFIHCSFFLPFVVNEDPSVIGLAELSKMQEKDRAIEICRYGGEQGTQLISEMLREIVDRGFIK